MANAKAGTNAIPCRNELILRFPMVDGRLRTVIIRESVVVEDPYLKMVRAKLYTIKNGTEFGAEITSRALKDVLIKQNIQI
jgi:hypothetical protein